jgi:hypothetical protein
MHAHTHVTSVERYHPRVAANLMVTVHTGHRAIVAKAKDLSLDGLFVFGVPGLADGRVMVSIPLPDGEDVVTPCEVTRAEREGVALQFSELDWDDLIALARFLHPRLP